MEREVNIHGRSDGNGKEIEYGRSVHDVAAEERAVWSDERYRDGWRHQAREEPSLGRHDHHGDQVVADNAGDDGTVLVTLTLRHIAVSVTHKAVQAGTHLGVRS